MASRRQAEEDDRKERQRRGMLTGREIFMQSQTAIVDDDTAAADTDMMREIDEEAEIARMQALALESQRQARVEVRTAVPATRALAVVCCRHCYMSVHAGAMRHSLPWVCTSGWPHHHRVELFLAELFLACTYFVMVPVFCARLGRRGRAIGYGTLALLLNRECQGLCVRRPGWSPTRPGTPARARAAARR